MTLLSRLRARPVAQALFLATAIAAAVGMAACGDQAQLNSSSTPAANATQTRGQIVFAKYCNSCHPGGGRGAGPSLVQAGISESEFDEYVRKGRNRMPAFNEGLISNEDLDEMYSYVSSMTK